MPELILSGFGNKDITIDLTGKTPEQAIEQAIEQVNEKGKSK
jgi:mannitol/fructose-specific phosphotransferase system IIA component (Ntr-type)